jgi:hypothetical protein
VRKLNSEAHTLPQYQQMKVSDKDRIGAGLGAGIGAGIGAAAGTGVGFSYTNLLKRLAKEASN